jgi:heme exporter protein A
VPALSVHGVARRFGRHVVLRDATFDIAWGSVTGLLGANGAGKTTLLRILAGSLSPNRGSLAVGGSCVAAASDALRQTTALLAGDSYLYEGLTAAENLSFAVRMTGGDASEESVADALRRVGLERVGRRAVRDFSSGMRKRLALARVVAMRPPILLLDEPYASLDEDAMGVVDGIIEDWRQSGRAVVMATHLHSRAEQICDDVLYLVDGIALPHRGEVQDETASRRLEVVR